MSAVRVFLSGAGSAEAALSKAFARELRRLGRRRSGHARLDVVVNTGDPAGTSTDLDDVDWFVLLASPASAGSERVGAELRRWVEQHGTERLLPVLTEGTWVWDAAGDDLDGTRSTAVPPALIGVFGSEPRHLDMTWARSTDAYARDARFKEAVAEAGAPPLGLTKDELVGEDVRRQRRTLRLTRATAAVLTALTLVAAGSGVVAASAAAEARREESRAVDQRRVADQERERAERERSQADSRRLAAMADQVQSEDGSLARLLAVAAYEAAPTAEATRVLDAAAQLTDAWAPSKASAVLARLVGHDPATGARQAAFSPDGSQVVTKDGAGVLRFWQTDEPSSPVEVPRVGGSAVAYTADGSVVAVPAGGMVRRFDDEGTELDRLDVRADAAGAFGPSGLVLGGKDGVAVLEDGRAGKPTASIDLDLLDVQGAITFVGAAADASLVVVGTDNGEVRRLSGTLEVEASWQLDVAENIFPAPARQPQILDLSADGELVLMPPDGSQVTSAVMENGNPIEKDKALAGVYRSSDGTATSLVANPQGQFFSIEAPSAAFVGGGPGAVAVSPGGLESPPALASNDPGVEVDDVPLPTRAHLVEVSADGSLLLVGGEESGVVVVDLDDKSTPDPVAAACRLAGRNFSEPEWETYLPDRGYDALCDGFDAPFVPGAAQEDPEEGSDPTDEPAADPFDDDALANGTLQAGCFIEPQPLKDGKAFDDNGQSLTLLGSYREDMNGDGVIDAVLELECTGATSPWIHVLALDGSDPDALEPLAPVLQTRSLTKVGGGRVVVTEPDYAPDDPQCCPSGYRDQAWVVAKGQWVED